MALLRKETELIRKLSRAAGIDDLLEDILIYIRERWGFDTVGIQLVDECRKVLRGYRTQGVTLDADGQAVVTVDVPLQPRASVSAWVAVRRRSLYVHPSLTPATARMSELDRRASAALRLVESLIVPVVEESRTLGVVHFGVRSKRPPLDEEQLKEVRAFILGMTAPIRGVVIREALERSRREQAEVAELCRRISATIELDRLLDLLGEQVMSAGLFDGFLVSLPDPAGIELISRGIHLPPEFAGMEAAYADVRQPLDEDDPLVEVYRTAQAVIVSQEDLSRWPSLRHRFERWRIHMAAILPLPLDEAAGGVVFAFRQQGEVDRQRLQLLEQRLSLFSEQIRNAQFYSELRRREVEIENAVTERQRFLDLANHLIELTDPDQIYRTITRELLGWLPFDLAGIVLREGNKLPVRCISVRDQELEALQEKWRTYYRDKPYQLDPSAGATAFAYVHNSRVLIPDVMQVLDLPMSPLDRQALELAETPRTFLFIPIRHRQEPIGVLWLISVRKPVDLPETDVKLIEALCAVIGTAIFNAELYETVESQRREIETALGELRRTQKQLASAKAAAEASAAAKSVFVANTSHEIRTPLTAIIGFAETLIEQMGSESEVGQAAGAILRNGRHLLGLINDILDLSKIEAGRLEFERKPYAPAEILQDVLVTMGVLAREKGLHFRLKAGSPIPERVVGDAARVRQALFNLCNNAIKFTRSGGIDLEIRCDMDAELLRIRVQDTGIGIRQEDLAKLFQPFTQVEDSVSRRYGGTGLGLAITRQLIEGMGGTVGASSTVGEGSVFDLTIPTGPLQGVPTSVPTFDMELPLAAPAAPGLGKVRLRGRVLFAEDSRDNRLLIQHYLDQLGLQPVAVENGEQAIAAALSESFDLVILDIQMPGKSGLEALTTLRSCGFDKPVIALTANVMATDVARYREAGFDACLGKPIDRRRFAQTLRQYLPLQETRPASLDRPDLAALAARFASELPERLARLENSLQAGDWDALAGEAHKLKGTAGVFGWPAVGELAAEIEKLVRTVPNDPARQQALETAMRQVRELAPTR